ncbi:hypothetical protein pA_gene0054 [Aeromonas phage phiA008]|nr:hypothetical protein pA_gene0054 [Aeromonas phage phiA008]
MQEMNQDQMVQGLQAKVSQLDILLHEALQEKMELKQQYGQMQNNINAAMQNIAGKVAETRKFIDENVKDKKAAAAIIGLFDENFGQYKQGGQNAVDTGPVA